MAILKSRVSKGFYSNGRERTFHIETDGCIVNIRVGLRDIDGRAVTSVSIVADNYPDSKWGAVLPMASNSDAKAGQGVGIRVVKIPPKGSAE